jgi:putative acetyltransferase
MPEADISPFTEDDLDAVRGLFGEYASSLTADLAFQSFDDEMAALPGGYAPPTGALLLARVGGEPIGCVALRRIDARTCELKRLFLRPAHRGSGTGLGLLEAAVAEARRLGYLRLRLDTIPEMARAQALYERYGFREIGPYRENPVAGARFLELEL